MEIVAYIGLVMSMLTLLAGGGLFLQKRKEGEQWGQLVEKVSGVARDIERYRSDTQRDVQETMRRVETTEKAVTQFQTALLGIDGKGGALGEIAVLRQAKHEHGDSLHGQRGMLSLHDQQLVDHEARIGKTEGTVSDIERRAGSERRSQPRSGHNRRGSD